MKTKYCMKCMLPISGETVCPHCGYEQDYGALPHRLQPGTVLIDRYLIGCAIGQGGFGITYVGRDLKLDLKVAVKEYYPSGYANRNCQVSPEITIVDKAQKDFIETGKKKSYPTRQTVPSVIKNEAQLPVSPHSRSKSLIY